MNLHHERLDSVSPVIRGAVLRLCDLSEIQLKRKLLIVHGDEFDAVMLAHRWLAFVGDAAYTALMKCNVVVNAIRSRLGRPHF